MTTAVLGSGARAGAAGGATSTLVPLQLVDGDHVNPSDALRGNVAGFDMPPDDSARHVQFSGSLGERHVSLHSAESTKPVAMITGYHGMWIRGQSAILYSDTNVTGYGMLVDLLGDGPPARHERPYRPRACPCCLGGLDWRAVVFCQRCEGHREWCRPLAVSIDTVKEVMPAQYPRLHLVK